MKKIEKDTFNFHEKDIYKLFYYIDGKGSSKGKYNMKN